MFLIDLDGIPEIFRSAFEVDNLSSDVDRLGYREWHAKKHLRNQDRIENLSYFDFIIETLKIKSEFISIMAFIHAEKMCTYWEGKIADKTYFNTCGLRAKLCMCVARAKSFQVCVVFLNWVK